MRLLGLFCNPFPPSVTDGRGGREHVCCVCCCYVYVRDAEMRGDTSLAPLHCIVRLFFARMRDCIRTPQFIFSPEVCVSVFCGHADTTRKKFGAAVVKLSLQRKLG